MLNGGKQLRCSKRTKSYRRKSGKEMLKFSKFKILYKTISTFFPNFSFSEKCWFLVLMPNKR